MYAITRKATYRRSLIIFILVTFLFLPFSKPKQAKAIAGVDDAVVILGLVFLSLAGYTIVANDDEMVKDIGRTVGEGLDGMWDITMGEDGFIATSLDWYADKFTESYIGKEFGTPKTVSKFEQFPYSTGIAPGNYYGQIDLVQNAKLKLEIYTNNVLTSTTEKSFTAGTWLKIGTSTTNRYDVYRFNIVEGEPGTGIWNQYLYNDALKHDIANPIRIELTATDVITGNPITDGIGVKNEVTIPYDGTQVKAHDTPVEVPKGTTISVPKETVDKVASGSLPTTVEKVEDLGVTVDKDVAGDDVITGWGWLDDILNSILDGIKAIPGAITGWFYARWQDIVDIKDFVVSIPQQISAWWDSIWTDVPAIDFTPLTSVEISKVFPFSIPFDLKNLLEILLAEPKAPVFEIPLWTEKVTLDLTKFNLIADIVRVFCILGWCFYLINRHKQMEE